MLAIRQTKRSSRCLARKLRTRMGQVPTRSAGTSVSNTLGNGDSGVLMVGNCSPAKIAPLSAPCYYTPTGVSKQYAFAGLRRRADLTRRRAGGPPLQQRLQNCHLHLPAARL